NCDSPGVYHVEEAGQRQDHRHGPFALLTTHRNYPGFWEEPSRQGFLQTGGASPLPHYHRDLHPFREPSAGPKRGWIEDRRLLSEELPDLGESLSLDRGYLDQCRAALRASGDFLGDAKCPLHRDGDGREVGILHASPLVRNHSRRLPRGSCLGRDSDAVTSSPSPRSSV